MKLSLHAMLLLLCLCATPLLCQKAFAQASSGSFASSADQQNLPAAEEQDETLTYKHSPAVQAVGRALHLSPRAASSVFEYFNFAILAIVILYFLVRTLPGLFRARQTKIDQQLQEARTATAEANERLQIVEQRLSHLDEEIEKLRSRSEADAAADEQRTKQAIEEERKRIVASAEQEIAAASAVAERGLRKFAAELALERAAGRLRLSDQEDRVLIQDFADGLENALQGRRN